MNEQNVRDLLAEMIDHQNRILEEVRALQKKNKKDFWDVLSAVAPILAAVVIALGGTYFTWTYNQQQLKLQQIQTIEKFIPHLLGDEKSKRAAILAISSLGDDKLASRMASIFASPGTASALESIAKTSSGSDTVIVTKALYKTLDALAQGYSNRNQFGDAVDAYRRALQIKEQSLGKNSPELAGDLDKLAALYEQQGDRDSAQRVHDRADSLRAGTVPQAAPPPSTTVTTPAPAAASQPATKAEPEVKPTLEPPLPHLNSVEEPKQDKKPEPAPEQKAPPKPTTTEPVVQPAH
jgi:tetratricopeptide (TPR) repeat protein